MSGESGGSKKRRPSPVALVQSYFDVGAGAESTDLLTKVMAQQEGGPPERVQMDSAPALSALRRPVHTIPQAPYCEKQDPPQVQVHQQNRPDNEPANKPDTEPVKLQAANAAHEPDSCPAYFTANYPVSKPVTSPLPDPAFNPALSGSQPDQQAHEPGNVQAHEPAFNPVTHPSNKPATESAVRPALNPGNYPVDPEMWYPFTEKQGRVLLYLIQAGGIAKRDHISNDTDVNIATVKHTLRLLAKEGYISNVQLYVNHSIRGFSYNLNHHMCDEFAERLTGQPVNYPDRTPAHRPASHPIRQPAHRPGYGPAYGSVASFSSRSLEKNLTTTQPANQSDDILRDPELGYWREKGVTARQVDNWAAEFGMEADLVIQSLKHCRFEMVVLNHEEEKKIENPVNWFYKVMLRSGLYPRPSQYKSLAEQRAEEMERAAKEAAATRERQVAAERELAFQNILQNPDAPEYQALLSKVGDFAKSMGGKAFESALRDAFNGGEA